MGKEEEEEERDKENKMGKYLQQYLNSCKEDKMYLSNRLRLKLSAEHVDIDSGTCSLPASLPLPLLLLPPLAVSAAAAAPVVAEQTLLRL